MELEEGYKQDKGSGHGTVIGYTVEARYEYPNPIEIDGQIFDNRWREVKFSRAEVGVPQCAPHQHKLKEYGLLSYPAAQALRWWLHAIALSKPGRNLCLESRLIKHDVEYSHKITAVSAHELIGGDDRSNCIPKWNVQQIK